MRTTVWKREVMAAGLELPDGFRSMKPGFVREHEWIAECLTVASSGFSQEVFYVNAFALPRFIPSEFTYMTYGFRVGGSSWNAITPELVRAVHEALPTLAELATLDGLRDRAADPGVDVHKLELLVAIAILQADSQEFDHARGLVVAAGSRADDDREWVRTVYGRIQQLIDLVEKSGYGEAQALLSANRAVIDRLLV